MAEEQAGTVESYFNTGDVTAFAISLREHTRFSQLLDSSRV